MRLPCASLFFLPFLLAILAQLPNQSRQLPLDDDQVINSSAPESFEQQQQPEIAEGEDVYYTTADDYQPRQLTINWSKVIETAFAYLSSFLKPNPIVADPITETPLDADSRSPEARQNLDVQSVINSNLEKQLTVNHGSHGHSHGSEQGHSHEGAAGSAASLFSPPTPPRPTGIFGFSFPYVNPISILLQPFRFMASTLFGGFRRAAVASINMGNGVKGELVFSQLFPTFPVMISGRITGLAPGEHAFHVHEFGDLREGCLKAGDHYNPFHSIHAAPSSLRRHVGDLGNIIADNDGVARVSILDHRLNLFGPFSVLGRSVVIHGGRDDLGVGGNPSSGTSGNAGDRVACAVIGGGR